jgi:hypothetical protein
MNDNDPPKPNTDRLWSEREVKDLRAAIELDRSVEWLANFFGRTKAEIIDKVRALGVSDDRRNRG